MWARLSIFLRIAETVQSLDLSTFSAYTIFRQNSRKSCKVVLEQHTRKRVTTSEPVFRKVLILQGFGGIIQEKNFCSSLHQFSPFSGVLFGADVAKNIRSGIEVVITGLTRNQFGSNPTRVRIPPAAPKKFSLQAVLSRLQAFLFAFWRDGDWEFMCQFSPKAAQFSPKPPMKL